MQVMIDFREHERVKRGRTTEVKGTESQRPSQQHDPMGSMKWLNKVNQIPAGLVKQSAAEKVKTLCTLADMSEELSVEEAAEIVELGAVNPLIDLVDEAEDEHKDRGIHQYLHGTKEGTAEEQDKWVWQVTHAPQSPWQNRMYPEAGKSGAIVATLKSTKLQALNPRKLHRAARWPRKLSALSH